mgnify:CR=1 FL=1
MQIGSTVVGNQGIFYQNNDNGIQNDKYAKTDHKYFVKKEVKEEENSVDSCEVGKPWLSMGTKVRERLEKQTVLSEETVNEVENIPQEDSVVKDEMLDSSDEEYMEFIRKHIEEMQEKLDNGEVNETFQIGAKSFTLEEWKKLLEEFDSIQEILKELMKERHEKLEQQRLREEKKKEEQIEAEMLLSESTFCTYPASDDTSEEVHYITWYTEEGIFCRKAGQTERYAWSIPFENKNQYDKVMEFIGQLSEETDFRFTVNQNFWEDFLKDEMDIEFLKDKYTKSIISDSRRTEIKVSNFKEYETTNYKFVPEPTIGEGGMRILKNGQSVAVFSVDDLKIRVDEKTGTRVLISEISGFGASWYDALPVDVELESGLAEAIGVDEIPEVALEGVYSCYGKT